MNDRHRAWTLLSSTCCVMTCALTFMPARIGSAVDVEKTEKEPSAKVRDGSREAVDRLLGGIDRQVRLHPVTPKTGITSGLVIAYGHVIRSPYSIEYKGDLLVINGVQVEPSLVEQQRKEKLRPRIETTKSRLDSGAVRKELKQMLKDGRSREDVMRYVGAHSDAIEHAKWAGENSMLVKFTGGTYELIGQMRIGGPQQKGKTAATGFDAEAFKQQRLRELRATLEKNDCIFFLSSGGIYRTTDVRRKVFDIMTDKRLSQEQDIEQLKERVFPGADTPALDVVANFAEAEWRTEAK